MMTDIENVSYRHFDNDTFDFLADKKVKSNKMVEVPTGGMRFNNRK